ncbi:MAG: 16S rRNA (adenine(1518)-N(6)/adenine(1519)-N(6))-dimethyltransferase [Bacteroidetes bacterium CG02_land_8_20_14_3_00_31_25]|nr:MAG: 16S rRNA (adenine(1518)-N(6)/adenine(1519)-N(6))-dimethyltransferase [Bacteroidetes bacterium CG02_land_8_20_14_3_00_31_25]
MNYVRPKKSLGQHFLTDTNIARKIVNSLTTCSNVLEIGPGKGVLTKIIIEKNIENFKVIEIDSESVEYLKSNINLKPEQIIFADFLKTDIKSIFENKFSIIGNFPYNIGSQIFFKVLQNHEQVVEVVCMLQKEVAQRIATESGSKVYGILSVLLQTFYNIEYLFTVNEKVFNPPPKVKSAVIRLTRNNRQKLECDENLFFNVVKTSFNQRRKTLSNSLKPVLGGKKIDLPVFLKRPEQLTVDEFIGLTKIITSNQ